MYKSLYYNLQQAESLSSLIANLVRYGTKYKNFCFFNSNENTTYYRFIAGFSDSDNNTIDKKGEWNFGYLSYDLKNEIEVLHSKNKDNLEFDNSFFFTADVVVCYDNRELIIHYNEKKQNERSIDQLYEELIKPVVTEPEPSVEIQIQQRVKRDEYIKNVLTIKEHIQRGDIYEVNYCVEFFAEHATIDPAALYLKLNEISEAPFSSFAKFNHNYVIGSSPERFLKKQGEKLITQPIKGTAGRGADAAEDEHIKQELKSSLKERTENVMIVDVARNDLSRIAERGSVVVDELYGIYTFPQVHQMISTVSCMVEDAVTFNEIVQATFPMASMTGAPKIRAMQLIDEIENSRRSLYSGSLGYITPNGDFDLNVVIRSILFNETKKYVSFSVGGAITYLSDPESEYEECLLKAKAMIQVLNAKV